MPRTDPATLWSLNYRLVMRVIADVGPDVAALGLEPKELFVLGKIDDFPYPAELADTLCMPKPTVTTNLKRLEAAGFVKRQIDPDDLRRHRLQLTASGRRVTARGMALLASALDAYVARLSAAERADFQRLLEKMLADV